MARKLPEVLLHHVGRVHFLIALAVQAAAHVSDQRLEQRPALRVPEDGARRLFLEMEEIHLAAKLSVIALLGFLEAMQIVLELVLRREGRAVDALKLRVVAVAAPIGARELHQLEGLADLARGRHVRATAEIEPFALLVDLEILAGRNGVHQLDLEHLALVAEELLGLLAAPELLREGRVLRDDLRHLLFDLRNVFRLERLLLGEIVEEAVLDDGADRHLRAGPQRLDRFGHHVRGVVPDQLQGFRVRARDELDRRVRFDGIGKIREHSVEAHRDRALCERGRDRLGDLEPRDAGGHLAGRAIGKRQRNLRLRVLHRSAPLTRGIPIRVRLWSRFNRRKRAGSQDGQ